MNDLLTLEEKGVYPSYTPVVHTILSVFEVTDDGLEYSVGDTISGAKRVEGGCVAAGMAGGLVNA